MLGHEGFSVLTEFPVKSGRRMDVCALGRTGEIWCVEVKSSRADFLADQKWPDYLDWCDRLYFAVPEGFPEDLLPSEHGLIRTDEWDAEILRDTTPDPLGASLLKIRLPLISTLPSRTWPTRIAPPRRAWLFSMTLSRIDTGAEVALM